MARSKTLKKHVLNRNLPRRWQALHHEVLRVLRDISLKSKTKQPLFILALSGGMDSVVLGLLLRDLKSALKWDLLAVYLHHGEQASLQNYRSQAQIFCQKWCQELEIPFVVEKYTGAKELKSEKDLRDWRWSVLKKMQMQTGAEGVITGHHLDDLLETRLLRLLRGSGFQGLKAMEVWNGSVMRPLLGVSRLKIQKFAQENRLQWMEDPSNADTSFLRNWLRHEWLPLLEKKNPAYLKSLARSFENLLAERENAARPAPRIQQRGRQLAFDLKVFLQLTASQQRKQLISSMTILQLDQLRVTQIEEIRKRLLKMPILREKKGKSDRRGLDKRQKQPTFVVGQAQWSISKGLISVRPLASQIGTLVK